MNARNALSRTYILLMFLMLALSSCDVFGGLANPEDSDVAFVRFMEPVNGTIDLSLYATDPNRKAYVVFTTGYSDNLDPPVASSNSAARSTAAISTDKNRGAAEQATEARRKKFRESLERIEPASSRSLSWAGDIPADDKLNDNSQFKVIENIGTEKNPVYVSSSVYATCRFNRKDISFDTDRIRSLSIWVADDCWDGDLTKINQVTETMVDNMAKAFFGISIGDPDSNNPSESIYAWVTNILEDEWGESSSFIYDGRSYSTIGKSDNITILIADIYGQNTDEGGVVGYFDSSDLVLGAIDSNQRVMFAIDAVMFASADGAGGEDPAGWDSKDYWPQEIFSTLAHEFQHMIHFYQKGVVAGADLAYEPTWIDELCSMQVEDLIADKMGVPGPRGVDPGDGTAGESANYSGRLPEYLLWPDVSPLDWDSAADSELLRYYSWAYSFGAYLTRNYGSAEFIRRIVQSSTADVSAVVAAASVASERTESMDSLLRRWGAAVLLSGRTDAPDLYRYNKGDFFISTVDGRDYRLGSINMYNYVYPDGIDTDYDYVGDEDLTEPWVYSSTSLSDISGGAYSNAFMSLGNPAYKPGWRITVPEGMYATVVID